jgi:hypothetical protein
MELAKRPPKKRCSSQPPMTPGFTLFSSFLDQHSPLIFSTKLLICDGGSRAGGGGSGQLGGGTALIGAEALRNYCSGYKEFPGRPINNNLTETS